MQSVTISGLTIFGGWNEVSTDSDPVGELEPIDVVGTLTLKPAPESPRDDSVSSTARALANVTKCIAWISSSAAGIGFIAGVIGYLSLTAHDSMLGIPSGGSNVTHWMTVGGLFFSRSIVIVVGSLIRWETLGVLALTAVAVVAIKRSAKSRYSDLVKDVILGILLICLITLIWHATDALGLADLLFQQDNKSVVAQMLLQKDTTHIKQRYGLFVLVYLVVSAALFWLIANRGGNDDQGMEKWRLAMRWTAVPLWFVVTLMIPGTYGVMTISNDYPRVMLFNDQNANSSTPDPSRVFLLGDTDEVLMLFDSEDQRIRILKRDTVERYDVLQSENILLPRP